MNVIEIEAVSKKYSLGDQLYYYTLRDSLSTLFSPKKKSFGKLPLNEFWALQDVSFSVKEGEIVGILGRNGAGKSTLLKILSRITPPTKGRVALHGRLGSLLEVGTGFHPELSGRENIFLNGALLGMTRDEVREQFAAIVEFSEVEKFLDTPMKRYSSGMYMRLAFSVAAHLRSEILLVDEVLAVGDAQFQKKCLGKMGDIANQGRTILFVSHNIGAISSLCTKSIVLDQGKLVFSGSTNQAIKKYLHAQQSVGKKGDIRALPRSRHSSMTAVIETISMQVGGKHVSSIKSNDSCVITMQIRAKQDLRTGAYLLIKDESRRPVLLLSSGHFQSKDFFFSKGKHTLSCQIDATKLTSGQYSVDCGLLFPNKETVDLVEDAFLFSVTDSDPFHSGFDYSQQWGSQYVHHQWNTT